ncbi:MAG: hypothetical protein GWN77_06530, partial [Gammaproteobacteria bacterium]|nr:hypothetical protein [Gammaproteobacteria bacterium]
MTLIIYPLCNVILNPPLSAIIIIVVLILGVSDIYAPVFFIIVSIDKRVPGSVVIRDRAEVRGVYDGI